MKKRFKAGLLLLLVGMSLGVFAQDSSGVLTGTVTSSLGKPLPGVSIRVEDSTLHKTLHFISDTSGGFQLRGLKNQGSYDFYFSFIGYEPDSLKNYIVDTAHLQPISITLKEAEKAELNDVVVVGYGTTRKSDLTGAVSTIGKKDIENIPATRVDQMLQGKAAGVQVTSGSGAPGSSTSIRIRGGNSINASNEPLYVIDGLIGGGDINLINPEDIESMVVLKDASATAIYGARGANGVILVTTKRGLKGEDNINLGVYYGIQKVPKFIPMLSGKEYAELANESSLDNNGPVLYDLDTIGVGTNWQKEISQVAPMRNVTLSASGGKDKYTYFLSGNYNDQEGVIINSGFKRYQFRANLTNQLKKNVKLSTILNIGRSLTGNNTISLGGLEYGASALAYSPIAKVYNPDGSFSSTKPNDPLVYSNPVAQGTLPVNEMINTNLMGNMAVEWTLTDGLVFKSTFGTEMNFNKANQYLPGSMPDRANAGTGGAANVTQLNTTMILNENTLSYDKDLATDHHISAVIGTSYQTSTTDMLHADAYNYTTDLFTYNNLGATDQTTFKIGSSLSDFTIMSYLARFNYSYKDKYLVTLTGRSDGSSRFSENHKRAFFPAAALAWKMSDEPFIKNLHIFDNLKLRTSLGYNGNQAIDIYSSLPAMATQSGYIIGGQNILGYTSDRIANPDLKWETTRQFDLGLEMGFLHNNISLELDYYNKLTSDLLLNQPLATQTGFSNSIRNIGSVSNKGLELSITTKNFTKGDFKWSTTLNLSHNTNKVVDLGGVDGIDVSSTGFGSYSTVSRLIVGQPVGTFWGATYMGTQKSDQISPGTVNPRPTPRLGDPLYKDLNGDGKFSVDDYSVIGTGIPKFFGGLGNSLSYKNLALDFFFEGTYGNKVMNVADAFYNSSDPLTNQFADIKNRWTPDNPNSDIPRVNSRDYIPSTRWVYNGSYLRLKTLTLSYTFSPNALPAKWLKGCNIYVSGTNLLLITKYPYYDPETNAYNPPSIINQPYDVSASSTLRGFDYTNYPQNRTFVVGVKLAL